MPTRTADPTDDQAATDAAPASPNGTANGETKVYAPHDMVSLNIRVPFEMKGILEQRAKADSPAGTDIGIGQWVRQNLASDIGYTLPPAAARPSRVKMDPEARKAARAEQYATSKLLLEALRSGLLGVDLNDLKAKLAATNPQPEAEAVPA